MRYSQARQSRWLWSVLPLWLALLAGCASDRAKVDQALLAEPGRATRNEGVAGQYVVRFPDVLRVTVVGALAEPLQCAVGLDGRIELGPLDSVLVEGQTPPEIALGLAVLARVSPDAVRVTVADYRSQHVYLCGEGNGTQRAIPYQGPETVLDLLQRVGGIEPGAAPSNVHVIRAGITDSRPPEVYRVDLRAVVLSGDQRTNLRIQPFDQLYVGETRRSSLQKCFPPWLRPYYESIVGLYRPRARHANKENGRKGDQAHSQPATATPP